jgi:hypothetical protein
MRFAQITITKPRAITNSSTCKNPSPINSSLIHPFITTVPLNHPSSQPRAITTTMADHKSTINSSLTTTITANHSSPCPSQPLCHQHPPIHKSNHPNRAPMDFNSIIYNNNHRITHTEPNPCYCRASREPRAAPPPSLSPCFSSSVHATPCCCSINWPCRCTQRRQPIP